jgi:hypothetical protein
MGYLDEVFSIINKAKAFGNRKASNGTELIGHVPYRGPEAWLHEIYAPLSDKGIQSIEEGIGKELPKVMHDFYRSTNGLDLFSTSLFIYGLRTSYNREGDAARLPFSIVRRNTMERPSDAKDSFIFIGGYTEDGSLLYIDCNTGHIYRCDGDSAQPLNEWPSFEEMLLSEVRRLEGLFDEQGKLIDPDGPTTPE